jgi:hypothetical protein
MTYCATTRGAAVRYGVTRRVGNRRSSAEGMFCRITRAGTAIKIVGGSRGSPDHSTAKIAVLRLGCRGSVDAWLWATATRSHLGWRCHAPAVGEHCLRPGLAAADSGCGRRCGEAPPVTRSARDAEANHIRAGQAPGHRPQRRPGAACPDYTVEQRSASPGAGRCGTAWLWPGTPLIAALQTHEPGRPRRPVRPQITRWSAAFADLAARAERYRDGAVPRQGGATLPVWKGLVHAGAAVYGLRGS